MIWVTSDLHFNHKNIIPYCNRPFNSVEEMNRALVDNWNRVVKSEDDVYILGDLSMGEPEKSRYWIQQLNGHHIDLIVGNHDTPARIEIYKQCGIGVRDPLVFGSRDVIFLLAHQLPEDYMNCTHDSNTCFLYGHVHDAAPRGFHKGTFHVGVDTNNFTPVSLDYIVDEAKKSWKKNDGN